MSEMVVAESGAESTARSSEGEGVVQSRASRARRWLGILVLVAISALHAAVVIAWVVARS